MYILLNISSEKFSMGSSYIQILDAFCKTSVKWGPWSRNLGGASLKKGKQIFFSRGFFAAFKRVNTNYIYLSNEYDI